MNRKVPITMLVLLSLFLTCFYVLKFIFPDILLLCVTDPNILKFGAFIESWIGYSHIFKLLTTFTTLYLFCCASCGRFKIKWYEFLYLLVGTVICRCCIEFLPSLYTHTSISVMLLLATLFKGNLTYASISFTIHGFLSQFLFSIRGFETIIQNINVVNACVLSIEGYVWLILLGIIFYLKEDKNNGRLPTTISK